MHSCTVAAAVTDEDEERVKRLIDWRMRSAPPLDGTMSAEQALEEVGRIEAWARWARVELAGDASPSRERTVSTVESICRVLESLRVAGPHARVDLRQKCIAYTLAAADASAADAFDAETATTMAVDHARKIAPTMGAAFDAERDRVTAAIEAWRADKPRVAVFELENVILNRPAPTSPAATKKAQKDAWARHLAWRAKRRERMP